MSGRQFEKVFAVLLAAKGEVVSKAYFETSLSNDVELYRLSTYIWNIRKKLGGDVKVVKQGKLVTGYQLVNFPKFESFTPKTKAVPKPKVAKVGPKVGKPSKPKSFVPMARAAAVKAPATQVVEPVLAGGEVPDSVDSDFDDYTAEDLKDMVS